MNTPQLHQRFDGGVIVRIYRRMRCGEQRVLVRRNGVDVKAVYFRGWTT